MPAISAVMPTTAARRWCIPYAVDYWLRQRRCKDELVVVCDGDPVNDLLPDHPSIRYVEIAKVPLSDKFNRCVELATRDWIALWADDDWHASWRLDYTAGELARQPGKEIAGLRQMTFYDLTSRDAWRYRRDGHTPYFLGGSLVFHRMYWERHPFPSGLSRSADASFTNDIDQDEYDDVALVLDNAEFYCAIQHGRNTGRSGLPTTSGGGWHRMDSMHVATMLGRDLIRYRRSDGRALL